MRICSDSEIKQDFLLAAEPKVPTNLSLRVALGILCYNMHRVGSIKHYKCRMRPVLLQLFLLAK